MIEFPYSKIGIYRLKQGERKRDDAMGQAIITIDTETGLETVTVTGRVNMNIFLSFRHQR